MVDLPVDFSSLKIGHPFSSDQLRLIYYHFSPPPYEITINIVCVCVCVWP